MRIVFVSKECPPSPRSWGIGSYVWETAHGLSELGHSVTIIAASDDGQETTSTPAPRMTIIRLPDDELRVERRNIFSRAFFAPYDEGISYRRRIAECLTKLSQKGQADIIEFPGFRGESAVWLDNRPPVSMVVRMHGYTAGIDSSWRDRVTATRRLKAQWEVREVMAADVITAVSENQASTMRSKFRMNRVKVVHNSIDVSRWAELSAKAPQEIGSQDILFAGALYAKKGIFVLFRAINVLRHNGWRGRLFVAGKRTAEFDHFLRLRAAMGIRLPEWVVLLGICQRERLAGLYRAAGACCFPSLIEPFSYTCLEAMACGGTVIGTSDTGMSEIITPTCGFLVSPGNAFSLAEKLNSVLVMGFKERQNIKVAAQERVRTTFDNNVILPKLMALYEDTVRSGAAKE